MQKYVNITLQISSIVFLVAWNAQLGLAVINYYATLT